MHTKRRKWAVPTRLPYTIIFWLCGKTSQWTYRSRRWTMPLSLSQCVTEHRKASNRNISAKFSGQGMRSLTRSPVKNARRFISNLISSNEHQSLTRLFFFAICPNEICSVSQRNSWLYNPTGFSLSEIKRPLKFESKNLRSQSQIV